MIYLDNAATSWPKPEAVYTAVSSFMCESCANPGRSSHRMARDSSNAVMRTRELTARLFNIGNPLDIAFTSNATHALNMAIQGVLGKGGHAVATAMEHNSVLRPLNHLKKAGLADYTIVMPEDGTGVVDPLTIKKAVRGDTRLIICSASSNVTGTILPYTEIGEFALKRGIPFLVDAAQGAGVLDIDVKSMDITLLAFSGHKGLLGPQGTGGLYAAPGIRLKPIIFGGTGSRSLEIDHPDFMPDMLEGGTLNTPGIVGLGAALDWIMATGLAEIRGHKMRLLEDFFEELGNSPSIRLYSGRDPAKNSGIVSLIIDGMDSSEIGTLLDERYGIAVRSGFHCAPYAHRALKTEKTGLVRLSTGCFNTSAEMRYAAQAILDIAARSKRSRLY
jgi:cysteine desulfurase/selenocysteine lyase